MSWDAILVADLTEGVVAEDSAIAAAGSRVVISTIVGQWNYTSNTNDMIRATGCDWPHDFGGLSGPDGAAYLHRVITTMENDPVRFEAMNPPNGWGDYTSLLGVLREMRAAVPERHGSWGIWW